MPVLSKPLTTKQGQTSAYRYTAREKVRGGAVRAGLRGYKIEKSKVTPIRAKVYIPLIHTTSSKGPSTECGRCICRGGEWIKVWYVKSQQRGGNFALNL